MKSNDSQLRQMFLRATDEVIPPAPWLETQIVAGLHERAPRRRATGGFGGFGSGVRFAAGAVALVVAIGTVAALLMSTHLLHLPTAPGARPTTVASPSGIRTIPFTPSPAVRAANWPAGGPVPTQLAGSWQQSPSAPVLHLAAYTFQLGEQTEGSNSVSINPAVFGNIVVNGSEIDFISDTCTQHGDFGFERFTYTLNGNTLVLTRAPGPGQTNCWGNQTIGLWPPLSGTYTRTGA